MVMTLQSKNTKTSSKTSDTTGTDLNFTTLSPTGENVATVSRPANDQSQAAEDQLSTLADGWRKQAYSHFSTGARVPWDSFWEDFKNKMGAEIPR